MPHKLVHPQNKPSIDIKEGGNFERAISMVRRSLSSLLKTGALNVLANYVVQNADDSEGNRVALNRLVGALLDETPIERILRGIDPFDKQNILSVALSNFEFPDDYIMEVAPVSEKKSDPSDSPTHRIRRSTPCPKGVIDR